MKRILIVLLLLNLLSCKRKNDLLTEAEVLACIAAFDKGWESKNPKLVDSVLSDKYMYYTQSGNPFNRENLIATAGSDIYSLQDMKRESMTMQIDGDAAVVNTIWSGKGVYHGEAFDDRQRCSITIVKHKGIVKILAEHCTTIKTPTAVIE